VGTYDKFYKARELVTKILEQDLVGPVTEDEVIHDLPTTYYVAGKLYPQRTEIDASEEEVESPIESVTDTYDTSISLSNQREPSSVGLTFAVSGNPTIAVTASFATYEYTGEKKPSTYEEKTGEYADVWERRPHSGQFAWSPSEGNVKVALDNEAEVVIVCRQQMDGLRIATATLVNTHTSASRVQRETAAHTLFQVSLKLTISGSGRFEDIDLRKDLTTDPECLELELLYRNVGCFAQGHGCAVEWDTDSPHPSQLKASFIPAYALRQMRPRIIQGTAAFAMHYLAYADRDDVLASLSQVVDQYAEWIDDIRERSKDITDGLAEAAKTNVSRCEEAKNRLLGALELLRSDDLAWRAFQLANQAMLLQREKSIERAGGIPDPDKIEWYPFQLAFFLQELRSFAEPTCPERKIADLLWFPTGGGKTEAYLGISAFAIFLRRLRDPHDAGVTVIMRYTLRLLTIQQFQRASLLIAACEHIRKTEHLGGDEISIGIWVGGGLTPNKLEEASQAILNARHGTMPNGGDTDPFQVDRCPWCGAKITPDDYEVDAAEKRMHIRCPNESCEYHGDAGLPIYIVDEDIYEHLPSFIVATVDKFAQVPKRQESSRLFGIGTEFMPPELIIQDELHLISGPLGTMVGIYEAAIERLCERDGIRPKIVASTATARNAEEQIHALYAEKHAQFPPQGLDIGDSFFAVEATPSERPTRLYMGVMGSGTTQSTLLIRVYSALLFATRYLETSGWSEDVVDAYWTIVGYFNTLRELGGSLTMVLDEVQRRFSFLAAAKFASVYPGVDSKAQYGHTLELTSRKTNAEVTRAMSDLEKPFQREHACDAFDFVLATNMISVGVDVARLGLMVVDDQPKSNSEYIQATSRVGRRNPGLVLTAFNASRSRDRSHYEQFLRFHSSLYRNVESTSVTPFSDRARDRGLQAILVMLCRYLVDGLSENNHADRFRAADPAVVEIEKEIVSYIAKIDEDEAREAERELREIARDWERRAEQCNLIYTGRKDMPNVLLRPDTEEDRFRTMNSMRNVEAASNVYLM